MNRVQRDFSSNSFAQFSKREGTYNLSSSHTKNSYSSTLSSYSLAQRLVSILKVPFTYIQYLFHAIKNFFFKSALPSISTIAPKTLNPYVARAKAFRQTRKAFTQGFYYHPTTKKKVFLNNLDAMKRSTQVHKYADLKNTLKKVDFSKLPTYHPVIEVVNSDTVLAGRKLLKKGYNPVLLNMANGYVPGGGVKKGCPAQEEEICRLTVLYLALIYIANQMKKYLIPKYGCIYSANVDVVRKRDKNHKNHFVWLKKPVPLSFISSAAYDLRPASKKDLILKQQHPKKFEQGMRRKIRSQIFTALLHGHDAIVLGAYGCGAFRQDPKEVSKWYKEELAPYKKYFRRICFAVLVTRESDRANLAAFQKQFSS